MKIPAAIRDKADRLDEIRGFLTQSNISARNLKRLRELVNSSDQEIADLAKFVLEIGMVHPHKRRRIKFLARERRDLLNRLSEKGLWWVY